VTPETGDHFVTLDHTLHHRFMTFTRPMACPLAALTALAFVAGLFLAFNAPEDALHGRTVLILFIHVPLAMFAVFIYMSMALAAAATLAVHSVTAAVFQRAAASVGACFAFLCLVTGALWGRPAWGAYWVWQDARLVSMLILFLMYCGSLALWNALDDPDVAATAVSILNLIGGLNAVLVKYSVDIWNTQHQKSTLFAAPRPSIDGPLFTPLIAMMAAFLLLALTLTLVRMRATLLARHARMLEIALAGEMEEAAAAAGHPG
jgi:heme exporter protein C